jgi:hypothetical protein
VTRRTAERTNPTLWKDLKVGDRVRMVHLPTEFSQPGYTLHRDTLRSYRRLIARARPLRVYQLDAWRMPWVRCRFRRKDGRWEHHSLLINHDGIVLVRLRTTLQK